MLIVVSAIFLRLLFERLASKSLDLGVTITSKGVEANGRQKEGGDAITIFSLLKKKNHSLSIFFKFRGNPSWSPKSLDLGVSSYFLQLPNLKIWDSNLTRN